MIYLSVQAYSQMYMHLDFILAQKLLMYEKWSWGNALRKTALVSFLVRNGSA